MAITRACRKAQHCTSMRKITRLFFFLNICTQGVLVVDASAKSPDGKIKLQENVKRQDYSSNEILDDEMKPKLVDQHYYLPLPTTFGSSLSPSIYGASITSPPQLTIKPSTVQFSLKESTTYTIIEPDPNANDDYVTPYLSHCMSETPSNKKLESQLLLPSKELTSENTILSGHIEIASKTSSEGGASEMSRAESEPSLVLKGSQIFMSSTAGM